MVAQNIRRLEVLEILQDSNWQDIGVAVPLLIALTLLAALISGLRWYSRRRRQRREVEKLFSNPASPPVASVRRLPRYSNEEQARQLFEAIYNLAEGNPGQWVARQDAEDSANIPLTMQDYDSLFRHLEQSGLITADNLVHNKGCTLTPKGAGVMERVANSAGAPVNSSKA
jgi:hypothetical protein